MFLKHTVSEITSNLHFCLTMQIRTFHASKGNIFTQTNLCLIFDSTPLKS